MSPQEQAAHDLDLYWQDVKREAIRRALEGVLPEPFWIRLCRACGKPLVGDGYGGHCDATCWRRGKRYRMALRRDMAA